MKISLKQLKQIIKEEVMASQFSEERQALENEDKIANDGGRNPCIANVPMGMPGELEIIFFKPRLSSPHERLRSSQQHQTDNRQFIWTGSKLTRQHVKSMTFSTIDDAEIEIRKAVIPEIRNSHPDDIVYIFGW